MSLVNDMLRDLDARRREAPTGSLGAHKLVPATDGTSGKKRTPMYGLIIFLILVLVVLLGVFYVQTRNNQGVISSPQPFIVTAPATPSGTTQTMPEPADPVISEVALSQLEQRLQQLEEQNRALLAAQQQAASVVSNPVSPVAAPSVQDQSSDYDRINQDRADAPALPADAPETVQPASDNTQSGTTRSPRELSLEERDRQQVQLALQQWSSGQQLAALQTLDQFSYQNADAHHSRETLAKLLIQQGEQERAMQAVELGLAMAPNHNGYRKLKARLLLASGTPEQAVELLQVSAPAVSMDTEYHDLLASAYLASSQHESASDSYRSLLQQNAAEGRWWFGLASSLDALGRSVEALTSYERALQQGSLAQNLRQISQQRAQAIRQNQTTF